MTYGERLALARIHAGLTQQELAVSVGMKQPSLAHLEKHGKGSAFTVKLARACGVSADWLDDEIGEMIPPENERISRDPRIEHVCRVMQSLPTYAVDKGVRDIDSLAEYESNKLSTQQPLAAKTARPARQPLALPPPQPGGGLPFSYKPGDTGRATTKPADQKKFGSEQ